MDYSSIHENEGLQSGSSPWASSPQHSRTLSRESTEQPASPAPAPLGPPATDGTHSQILPHGTPSSQPIPASTPQSKSSNLPYRDPRQPPVQPEPNGQQRTQQRPDGHQRHTQSSQSGDRQQQRPRTNFTMSAKINGMERAGRKDPMFRFDVHTNLPGFRTTQFRDIRRSHGEFKNLADHLVGANAEAFVPALPPASTSAGVGTDEDETKTKAYMQRWLNVVCDSDVLIRDDEVIRFIEGDPGYSPVINRKQPATGVRRKYIKQFAPPPDDTPELQDARPVVKRFYLGTMDAEQKLERLVKLRRGLGLAEAEFGQQLQSMSEQELHPGLKHAYRKVGRTTQTAGDLHAAQGTAEAATLGDPLAYHSADAFIVKETLTNRHILLRELLQAQQATRSKLNATDRLRSSTSVRRDKVDDAISALDESRTHEKFLHEKTQRVTSNLLQDRWKWFSRTAVDLRASIREFVVREIEAERRTLATLEAVRPDVRAIDASGGLSRLGREATPAARRAAMMSSQGPKGDAWSGPQRRSNDGLNRSISGSFAVPVKEGDAEGADGEEKVTGRNRAVSGASSNGSGMGKDDDDDDRVDARNAASRLAASTF